MQDTGHAYSFLGIVHQLTRPNSKPLLSFNSTHTSPRRISVMSGTVPVPDITAGDTHLQEDTGIT